MYFDIFSDLTNHKTSVRHRVTACINIHKNAKQLDVETTLVWNAKVISLFIQGRKMYG